MLVVYSGLAIALGQLAVTLLARNLGEPSISANFLFHIFSQWTLYAFVALYGSAVISMIILLRLFPLAQISITVFAVTLIGAVIMNILVGDPISLMQLFGVFIVFCGAVLINA